MSFKTAVWSQGSSIRPLKHAVSQILKGKNFGNGLWPNIAHIHRIDEITHVLMNLFSKKQLVFNQIKNLFDMNKTNLWQVRYKIFEINKTSSITTNMSFIKFKLKFKSLELGWTNNINKFLGHISENLETKKFPP